MPEVLIAAVVLIVIALAFYAGLSSGFLITKAAREDLRATPAPVVDELVRWLADQHRDEQRGREQAERRRGR